jgi:WD40 repeat protein
MGRRRDAYGARRRRGGASILSAQNAAEADRQAVRADANATEAQQLAEAEAAARSEADANAEEAVQNAALAESRELAASAINVLDEDPELSILLTLEAVAATPEGQEQPAEVIDALWQAVQQDRLVRVVETGYDVGVFVTLSPDDETLFVVNGFPVGGFPTALVLQAYSTSDFELLWEYQGQVGDIFNPDSEGDYLFLFPHVSPSGDRVSLSLSGNPARFMVFDAADGTQVFEGRYPNDCQVPTPGGWSPDGSRFVVIDTCRGAEILDGETFAQVTLIETRDEVANASFDDSGRLFLFVPTEGVTIYEPPDYSGTSFLAGVRGLGDASADGSTVVTFNTPTDPCLLFSPISRPADCGTLAAYDTATGEPSDLFTPLPAVPSRDGLSFGFSGADRLFAVPTEGAKTLVWDVETGEQVFSLPSGVGVNAATTSDGRRLFTGHQNGQFKVWDLSPNVGLDPVGDIGNYTLISANSNMPGTSIGAFVATDPGTFESQVFFFDLATGALVGQPVAGQQPITALADDRFLITESYTGGAVAPSAWFVYDPMSRDRTRIAGCDVNPATGLCDDGTFPMPYFWAPSLDSSQLLRMGDGALTLVDPDDGSLVGELTPASPFEFVGVFSDEMIGGSSEGQVLFENLVTGEELARIPDGGDRFEGDLGTSVFYRVESMAMVDMTTWDIWFFPIDLGRVQGIAVESDLRRLALGDENGVHVFDLDTGEKLNSIPIQGVAAIQWIDEDRVLVGTQRGTWAMVSLRTDDLIASAKAGVTRAFTADECETYRIKPCPTLEEVQSR